MSGIENFGYCGELPQKNTQYVHKPVHEKTRPLLPCRSIRMQIKDMRFQSTLALSVTKNSFIVYGYTLSNPVSHYLPLDSTNQMAERLLRNSSMSCELAPRSLDAKLIITRTANEMARPIDQPLSEQRKTLSNFIRDTIADIKKASEDAFY